jgi:multidrug efflux pump subunit AcrB
MIGPNLSEWSIRRRSLMIWFMLLAIGAGALAFVRMGRDEDPAFTFRTMVVAAGWPGATVEETLLQVTERLERTLQEVTSTDRIRSLTTAGQTTIFIDLLGATDPAQVPRIWQEVRERVTDMAHTLPAGTRGPFFNDRFGDTFGLIYGFTADGFTHRELRDAAEAARSRLLRVPDVAKIEVMGAQEEVVFLEFSPERLAGIGLSLASVVQALQTQNAVRPSGVVETGRERVALRVSGAFENEVDLAAVNIAAAGRLVRLADIAEIRRELQDPPAPLFRVNGQPAIGLAIAMRQGGDILQLGENLRAEMRRIRAGLPLGIEVTLVSDQAQTVDSAIGDFTESLWQAVVIIIVVSLIALGARAGLVVALSIPLTLAIVFPLMSIADIDLQRVSLGALIIALTLLVDDAMTTVDAMLRRLAAGDTKEDSATFAYKTLAAPMLTGTLVTIAGFVPIGFAASSAGEYTFSIFAVVGIALITSWFVAVLFAPLMGLAILKAPKADAGPPKKSALLRGYEGFLRLAIRARYLTVALAIAAFVGAVFLSRFLPAQFFPSSDRPELLVNLALPQSASMGASEDAAKRLDALLAADPDVARFSTYVGRQAIRFYLPLNIEPANPFVIQSVVVARSLAARDGVEERVRALLADSFPEAITRVSPLEMGPPVGWPLQWRVSGPDYERLRGFALELADLLGRDTAVRSVNFDWMEPSRQLRVVVDQDQARRLGLSSAQVAASLNAAVTGSPVTQLRDDIYLVNVVARATSEDRASLEQIRSIQIPIPGTGQSIAIGQIANVEDAQEFPVVWRRNRVPTLTVRADAAPGVLPDTVVARMEAPIAAFNARLPEGYFVEIGGTAEESAVGQASVLAVVPLMIGLMLTILMFQLQSFRRLGIVVAILPLGVIGVVLALLLFDRPLGFVAILGVLSLLGMIAKNGVILIVQIDEDRATGLGVRDAVVQAAGSRLRPMLLTALSTVLGLIPIAPTVFWGPMAFAIMGGLLVATVLTLVVLPALYVIVFERGAAAARPAKAA